MYEDLVTRLNAYSAEHECHGGITAEAADAIEELNLIAKSHERSAARWAETARKAVEQIPRWIPVTERLPEDSRYVLVCDVFGDITLGYRYRVIIGGIKYPESWELCEDLDGAVTHWMPLPEPPKEGTT